MTTVELLRAARTTILEARRALTRAVVVVDPYGP